MLIFIFIFYFFGGCCRDWLQTCLESNLVAMKIAELFKTKIGAYPILLQKPAHVRFDSTRKNQLNNI